MEVGLKMAVMKELLVYAIVVVTVAMMLYALATPLFIYRDEE